MLFAFPTVSVSQAHLQKIQITAKADAISSPGSQTSIPVERRSDVSVDPITFSNGFREPSSPLWALDLGERDPEQKQGIIVPEFVENVGWGEMANGRPSSVVSQERGLTTTHVSLDMQPLRDEAVTITKLQGTKMSTAFPFPIRDLSPITPIHRTADQEGGDDSVQLKLTESERVSKSNQVGATIRDDKISWTLSARSPQEDVHASPFARFAKEVLRSAKSDATFTQQEGIEVESPSPANDEQKYPLSRLNTALNGKKIFDFRTLFDRVDEIIHENVDDFTIERRTNPSLEIRKYPRNSDGALDELYLDEGGDKESHTFEVRLSSTPASDMYVLLGEPEFILEAIHLEIDPKRINFPAGQAPSWTEVTVTAIDDNLVPAYNNYVYFETIVELQLYDTQGHISETQLYVTITDNDKAEFDVNVQEIKLQEGGESKEFELKLSNAPFCHSNDNNGVRHVKVDIQSSNEDLITYSPSTLRFKQKEWNKSQKITVQAEHDTDFDNDTGTITLKAKYCGYGKTEAQVKVEVEDDDLTEAKLVVNPLEVVIVEGDFNHFTVKLSMEPTGEVTVTIPAFENTDLTRDHKSLTFQPTGDKAWNTPQKVTVSAAEDDDAEEDTGTISLTASGSGYDNAGEKVTVTVTDDDLAEAELVVKPLDVKVEEGGSNHFTVALSAEPTGDVTVIIPAFENTDLKRKPESLTFRPTGDKAWNTSQKVTVSAEEDADTDDDTGTINLTGSGGGYDNVDEKKVKVTVIDNDRPEVYFIEATGSVTEEVGDHSVEITVDPPPISNMDIGFQLGGTAAEGSDYTVKHFDCPHQSPKICYFVKTKPEAKNHHVSGIPIPVPAGHSSMKITFPVNFNIKKDDDVEKNETVTLTLTEPKDSDYKVGDQNTHTLTIINVDPPPTISLSTEPPNKVDEGEEMHITATISEPQSTDVTVPLTYPNAETTDTAESSDYDKLFSITIKANQDEGTGMIQTYEDDADYDNETFTVAIDQTSLASTVTAGDPKELTLIIKDDDPKPPAVSFASPSSSANENDRTHNVIVNISPAPAVDFTVKYALSGTASEGADYSITSSGTVSVAAGATSANIPVKIADDEVDDPGETVVLTLESGTGYNVGSPNIHTLTIEDNDTTPEVRFSSATTVVNEGAGTRNVSINISPAPSAALTLDYTLGGTATEGTDYSIDGSGTVSVAAGATSINIPVKIADDEVVDPGETVVLTLESGTGYNVASPSKHTLTITDNDIPDVNFASSSSSANENDGTHNVTVTIRPAPAADTILNYTLSDDGTAIRDEDYSIGGSVSVSVDAGATSVDISVKIIDDAVNENDETVILTLTGGTGYSVGAPDQHTLTITDNDIPEVSFASAADRVSEGVGTRNVSVNIYPAPAADLTLTYRLKGTADENNDYSISNSGMVSATAGETSVDIPVKIIDDAVNENDETVTLTLTGGTGYNLGSPLAHTLTIVDDDDITPPTSVTVTLLASPTSIEEGESVKVTATLSPPLSDEVTIHLQYEHGDPPTEPGDYDPLGQITIPGGSQSESGTIYIQDDYISEGEERFTVAINGRRLPSGVKLGSPSSVEITILDDDPPPPVEVSLSAAPNPVDEGKSVRVTATLTGILETDVDVPLEYNNETTDPPESGDYAQIQSITIPRGKKEGSEQIQTEEDADLENEIFIVSLGNLPQNLLQPGRETFQKVTIRDITSSEVIVNLSADPDFVKEGESVTVRATLSKAHNTAVMIPLKLTDDTAEKDEDYQASPPVQIKINAGETIGSYSIDTRDDEVAEGDETFTVAIGSLPSRLTHGEPRWVEVMIADNDKAGIKVPSDVSVVEGGENSFELSLTSKPLEKVTVTMSWPPGTDLTLQPITRIFTPETWNDGQQVTLSAKVDADLVDDPVEVLLTASGSSDYSEISTAMLVTINDQDRPGILVPRSVTMEEGSEKILEVALTQRPTVPVMVTLSGYRGTDLADTPPSPLNLIFTPQNYHIRQSITLTATKDLDLVNDQETLRLTASGGRYKQVMREVFITITDMDEGAIITAPSSVKVKEGGPAMLEVSLSNPPKETVMVTVNGHAGTDLTVVDTKLTFTSMNYSTPQLVRLSAAEDDDDYADEIVELMLSASGGKYNGVTANVPVTIIDNDAIPLTISIYDRRELEDAGAIQLPIELSRPTDVVVTVQYASTDGTAESGLDYTASRGIVIFDPGATRGVIEIEITDDEIPESTETFAVTLLKPQNAIIARGTGTGTILDNDGGTAILRVEDALVQEEEGMVRFQVSLSHPQRQMISAAYRTQDGTAKAGEDYEAASGVVTLAPGTLDAMIAVPLLKDGLDWQEETFTVHLESSENAEIAKAVGVATIQAATTVSQEALEAYTARFVRTSATQVVEALGDRFRGADGTACGAATRAEMARLWYSASSWDPSLGELLGGCRMSATSYSGSFSVWGRGAFRQFNGREDDGLTLDGEVTTGMLGADYRWKGGWLAGVLLSHSQGEGSFAAAQESGEITAGLTGVYPYVSVARAGWEVWLSAGAGRGQAEVLELDGDLTSRFGAMGVRGTLVSNSTIGLNYHGDVLVTDAEIEAHAVTAEVYRVRAGVEANARINNVLRPYVEANVRSDGGSAETGVGLEFGGGMRIAYPAWRLKADVHAQGLVMHTAEGFSEWGISGFVQVGNRSEGLMMRVRPSWGLGQGMSLYGQQTIRDAAPMGTGVHRTELELGYGVPWKEGSARSIMGMTQLSQGRMYRLGGELHPWERLTFSVFGLAHSRTASLGDIGVNVRGSFQY